VTQPPSRSALLVGLAGVALVLVGGRWLAVESAERAWAASIADGNVYLRARDLARLVHGLTLLLAVAWGTANLYYVYRAIGSVQLPRRLGDLEIVEAVPQRVLLGATLAAGLLSGVLLALGTTQWWLRALLALRPPHFGVVDPILQRDLGYYVGELPWAVTTQHFAVLAATMAALLVGLLYVGIGSLRWSGWGPVASPHARGHLALVLALLALALTRGATLDPAETVAGLHGSVAPALIAARSTGARFVETLGVVATLASLAWGLRDTARTLVAAWGALGVAMLAAYVVGPAIARGGPLGAAARDAQHDALEQAAFGAAWREEPPPPGFPTVAAAVATLPIWDADRVAAVVRGAPAWNAGAPVAGVALSLPRAGDRRAAWLVVPAPLDGGHTGALADTARDLDAAAGAGWTGLHRGPLARTSRALVAVEADSGLVVSPVATRDSVSWFGPGFREFAVAAPDSWPDVRPSGVPLLGWWRRAALAWVLQSPELARGRSDALWLLWRREVTERLERLAPFATFAAPAPIVADGKLWWVSYGYVGGDAFPLVRSVVSPLTGAPVRYLRAGFVGVVAAASGDTRLYLAPGADSVASTWARLFAPLVRPLDSLPRDLRRQLLYPRDAFRVAVDLTLRASGDSAAWRPQPRDPYDIVAPAGPDGALSRWLAQGFAAGSPAHLAGLLEGTMTPAGPELRLWKTRAPVPLPGDLVGSPQTAPGVLRLWMAEGTLLTEQGLFDQPATGGPRAVTQVYLTWGDRESQGPTAGAALRNLLASGPRAAPADTSLAARWEVARHLAAQADSALRAGDLETFGRLDAELRRLLGSGRKVAPARSPR